MKRSRFVVVAASTAAGAVLSYTACNRSSVPLAQSALEQDLETFSGPVHVLEVEYAKRTIGGKTLSTRTYQGANYGPTVETRPGQTLVFKIVNRLPPNVPATAPKGNALVANVRSMKQLMNPKLNASVPLRRGGKLNLMNNPHDFNTTNLHVHGIQTKTHLFSPVGTSNPSAMMIGIEPGQSFTYGLPVPADHPSGLFWYHPHFHGATDVQVSGGMAGLIVVRGPIDEVPEIKAAREIFMVFQTLDVNQNGITWVREYVPYRPPGQGGYRLFGAYTMMTTNGEGVAWVNNTTETEEIEQLPPPQYTVAPGEVVRLRFLNGTNYLLMPLAIEGFETYLIANDGINLLETTAVTMNGTGTVVTPENWQTAPALFTNPANRVELLLRAPATPGTYPLWKAAETFNGYGPIKIAEFVVSGTPVTMGIPGKLPVPKREYPLIQKKDIAQYRTFVFSEKFPSDVLLFGGEFLIDDKLYDEMETSVRPAVGTCEEWRIENSAEGFHPFHIHVNSFQLVAVNDKPVPGPAQIYDTYMVPPAISKTQNGSITIRIRFKEFTGKTVFHCHILPHEDTGMMKNFLIT
jgi:FtsP/CotA-like multicopper oxidase with cupredoxin domain